MNLQEIYPALLTADLAAAEGWVKKSFVDRTTGLLKSVIFFLKFRYTSHRQLAPDAVVARPLKRALA